MAQRRVIPPKSAQKSATKPEEVTSVQPSGRGGPFPKTMVSAVLGTLSEDAALRKRSWNRVARAYAAPIVSYIRLRWRKDESEAQDLAQSFFARCVERGTFGAYEPSKARFRTFLRVCLDRFIVDVRRADVSQKRGGGAATVPLDTQNREHEKATATEQEIEAMFEAEWTRQVLAMGVDALREQCKAAAKTQHFQLFERFHLAHDEPPSYAEIAEEAGISTVDVMNRLAYARRKFRALVLDILRSLTASDEEFKSEAKIVLGIDP